MIPFSPPRIDDKIIDEVTETLKSGWWTTGPRTKLFEKRLTEYCGNKATVAVSSATAGLELMLRWYGVGPGDEVIVPAYTYAATANVVMHCGATPVMVDARPDFNIDPTAVAAAITERTKVIMPVDIAGFPCNYEQLHHMVNSPQIRTKFRPTGANQETLGRILILADAAHSVGAWYEGNRSGSVTDVSVFSFHAVKNLPTAEGGAILLNLPEPFDNEALYKQLCISSLHGQSKDALAKMQKGAWRYDIVEAGYKCNMTDIQAAIGLVELERYDSDTLVRRKHIFEAYAKHLADCEWAQLPPFIGGGKESSYHVFILRLRDITEAQRDAIIAAIFELDVSVNVHFQPLPMFSFYKNLGYKLEDYPVALDNYSRAITLPVFYDLTDEQIATVANAVKTAYQQVVKQKNVTTA